MSARLLDQQITSATQSTGTVSRRVWPSSGMTPKVRALIGTFARGNRACFHAADGGGYRLLSVAVATLDAINPQIAARIVAVFNGWRRLEPERQAAMRAELVRLQQLPGLSPDCGEIIARALA